MGTRLQASESRVIDLINKKFSRLRVISRSSSKNGAKWNCLCDCGKQKIVYGGHLRSGTVTSCGCIHKELAPYKTGRTPNCLIDSFFKKIKKNPNGCWEWQGSFNKWGYGTIKHMGKLQRAHRVSWTIHKGKIPEKAFICHTCDNPSCCNPDHLWLG